MNEDVYKLANNVLRLENFVRELSYYESGKFIEMESLNLNHFIDSSAFDSIYIIDSVDQTQIGNDIDWEFFGSYAKHLTSISVELKKYKPLRLMDLNVEVENVDSNEPGSREEVHITTPSGELLIKISKKF